MHIIFIFMLSPKNARTQRLAHRSQILVSFPLWILLCFKFLSWAWWWVSSQRSLWGLGTMNSKAHLVLCNIYWVKDFVPLLKSCKSSSKDKTSAFMFMFMLCISCLLYAITNISKNNEMNLHFMFKFQACISCLLFKLSLDL